MIRLALLLVCLAMPAWATPEFTLPALFRVAGVEQGDTLNVRMGPGTQFGVVATLAPDASRIEAVDMSADGGWLRINFDEASGWVPFRFMAVQHDVATGLTCFGTEPFWTLRTDPLIWATPDGDTPIQQAQTLESPWFQDHRRMILGRLQDAPIAMAVTPGLCSDGMSDRAYGLTATGAIGAAGVAYLVSGCCSITP